MTVRILIGDVRERLKDLPDESVHCVVTSPPYFGLRDYGTAQWEGGEVGCDHIAGRGGNLANSAASTRGGANKVAEAQQIPFRHTCGKCGARRTDSQIGLEPTPDAFVATMVEVFREVRRVLRRDGTLWLNLGDSYANTGNAGQDFSASKVGYGGKGRGILGGQPVKQMPPGLKPKDLIGIPWRVAFALQADGWWLRQDIIWHKPNPMPESVRDRCTKAHEYLFLLTRSERYFYDAEAISEATSDSAAAEWYRNNVVKKYRPHGSASVSSDQRGLATGVTKDGAARNRRSVWTIATQPYAEAHFATFPPELPELCIKAGTSERGCCPQCGKGWVRQTEVERVATRPGSPIKADASRNDGGRADRVMATTMTLGWQPACACPPAAPVPATVLDPFGGAGTTALVADRIGRNAILIELNRHYAGLARRRIDGDAGMFSSVELEAAE